MCWYRIAACGVECPSLAISSAECRAGGRPAPRPNAWRVVKRKIRGDPTASRARYHHLYNVARLGGGLPFSAPNSDDCRGQRQHDPPRWSQHRGQAGAAGSRHRVPRRRTSVSSPVKPSVVRTTARAYPDQPRSARPPGCRCLCGAPAPLLAEPATRTSSRVAPSA